MLVEKKQPSFGIGIGINDSWDFQVVANGDDENVASMLATTATTTATTTTTTSTTMTITTTTASATKQCITSSKLGMQLLLFS